MTGHARRFVDDDQVGVLVANREGRVGIGQRRGTPGVAHAHAEHVPFAQRLPLGRAPFVEQHATGRQQALRALAAEAVHGVCQGAVHALPRLLCSNPDFDVLGHRVRCPRRHLAYTVGPVASHRDFYEILGVSPTASEDEIKRAYRKLAVELHPDRNPDDAAAEDRFKQASQAYAVLSDSEKRRRYDKLGHSAFTGSGGASPEQVDFNAFGDILEGLFDGVFRQKPKGRKARDLKYDLTIRFEEAALGCTKEIDVSRNVLCTDCKGTGAETGHPPEVCVACSGKGVVRCQRGFLPATRSCNACGGTGKKVSHPCKACHGEGVAPQQESLKVAIPAGVEDGSVRSVRGAGERTPTGQGDLHIYVHVKDHSLFTRDGADLSCTVPVSYTQAVLGDQLDVPTLEGKVTMRLPPGTESGRVFRLRGKGMPVFGGVGKGDQLVKVVVEIPQEVTPRQKELLEELSREMGEASLPQRRTFRDKLRDLLE